MGLQKLDPAALVTLHVLARQAAHLMQRSNAALYTPAPQELADLREAVIDLRPYVTWLFEALRT